MPVNFDRIPFEMRAYKQWICWRFEDVGGKKPTKVPYNPLSGKMASVTDPSHWCSFDEAVAYANAALGYDGIGFVLTKNDPYTFIDLDDTEGNEGNFARQMRVYQEFDSYSELSPSGRGLHIIIKAEIPDGRRRSSIELYSSERYMTMTGDVYADKPINERHNLAQILWAEMGGTTGQTIYANDAPETMKDEEILDRATNAANGTKFKALLDGNFTEYYPSQSEADFAFIDIVAFYTQNKEQIRRIFLASPLGQREKARRANYIDKMILRAFDRMLPPIDIVGLNDRFAKCKQITESPSGGTAGTYFPLGKLRDFHTPHDILPPPGLLGEIAQFMYHAAPRPVPHIAICGALGLLSGIIGRAYNISGTGLNQYILLLAETGTGKESMASGAEKLMSAVQMSVPAADEFLGPSEIASGQALLNHLNKKTPCFVSIVGEFGLKLQQLSNPRASGSEIMLKRVLLDLYNKSGFKNVVRPSVYADKAKDTGQIKRPAVTILGESTPSEFYNILDDSMITSGLLPRFMIIEYTGDRVPLSENHKDYLPSIGLIEKVAELASHSLTLQHHDKVLNVAQDDEARAYLKELNDLIDETMNATKENVLKHLWNRAHIKTLKVAAAVAVGCNMTEPVITLEMAKWAYNLVCIDILGMATRFSKGEIGKNTDENKQGKMIMKVCLEYVSHEYKDVKNYGVVPALHKDKIIPYSYISRRVSANGLFRHDKMGNTGAIKRTVQGLIDAGDLKEVGRITLEKNYSYTGRGFMLAQPETVDAAI